MSKSYKKSPWCGDISGIISKICAKARNTRKSTVHGTYATTGSYIHGKSIGRMCRKRIHM